MCVGRVRCEVAASAARDSVCAADGIRALDGTAMFWNLGLHLGLHEGVLNGWAGALLERRHG